MKIINVVGARPNFMKIAPIMRAGEHKRKKELKLWDGKTAERITEILLSKDIAGAIEK